MMLLHAMNCTIDCCKCCSAKIFVPLLVCLTLLGIVWIIKRGIIEYKDKQNMFDHKKLENQQAEAKQKQLNTYRDKLLDSLKETDTEKYQTKLEEYISGSKS